MSSTPNFATAEEFSSAEEVTTAANLGDIPLLKPSKDVPTSFKSSFSSWWSSNSKESVVSEERLFRRMPFFVPASANSTPSTSSTNLSPPDSDSHGIRASVSFVQLNNPKLYLNTLSIVPTGTNTATAPVSPTTNAAGKKVRPHKYPPTVILPGYGAGIGFFYLNFPYLGTQWVARRQSPIYAVDWLGMGRSARPPFPSISRTKTSAKDRVAKAENFFLDALEDWRQKMGIEKMALVGHSLGAYLSVAYALRFPERVEKLILLSPAGVPRDPNGMVPSEEVTQSGEDAASTSSNSFASVHAPTEEEMKERKEALRIAKKNESTFRKFATWAWEEGWSPFQVVRSMLFWGPWLVGKYSSRRFANLPDEDIRDMHEYIWHIVSAKGSGEYCVSHLLAPGVIARQPLVDRVAALRIPVTFVYGDKDWMSVDGGAEAVEKMREAGNADGRLYVVKGAGHHLYIDNVESTNELLVSELKRPSTTDKERATTRTTSDGVEVH